MTLNIKKTIFFLWDLCLIFKTMCAFSDTSIASKAYLSYQVIVALIFFFTFIRCIKGFRENLGNKIIFCSQFFVILAVYGLIVFNPVLSQEIGQQIKAMLFFYTASVSMTLCLESVEDQLKFLKHSYYSIGIVVFIAFVLYNDKFRFILNLSNLFSRDSRYRWEYGFYHANFVGNITICLLLLSFIISQIKKKINSRVAFSKVFCVGINTISICMLLASASRSNMLAIIVLGLAFLFANINEWLPIKRKYTGIIQGLIIILIIMLVLFSGSDNMYDSLFKLSNRNLNFTINIPSLIASGKVLFGIGYVDAGLFGSNKLPMATWYVDNSYLYVFLTMGIAGIAWFIVLLARLFLKIRKYDKAFGLNFTFTCVFVTYMFLGMSETCIFYPTFVSSFVYFVAFISCCFIKDNCDEST